VVAQELLLLLHLAELLTFHLSVAEVAELVMARQGSVLVEMVDQVVVVTFQPQVVLLLEATRSLAALVQTHILNTLAEVAVAQLL
jgi:hypothetical protein